MTDPALEALMGRVRTAAAERQPLVIRGGGTKAFFGRDVSGEILDTRAVSGVVAYEPTELVMTARAGTPLSEIEAALEQNGQMLGFEPPHYGAQGTLGGAIASGFSGPRRPYTGAARDFVLGVELVDGVGEPLRFGGRVMKNVAGFDVARLMTGALGTLGVLTEISLRCLPRPACETTLVRDVGADDAIWLPNEWGGRPLPLSGTCYHGGRLYVRLSGAEPGVTAARDAIGGEEFADGASFWSSVRDHSHSFFAARRDDASLWRLSVKSTAPYTDLGGEQLIEWGGALRWLIAGERTDAARVRAWAKAQGGHASIFRGPERANNVFQPLPEPLRAIHARLKVAFDPQGILNPGRMYAGV